MPTVRAAAAAKVHRQRRTVAMQQAGRFARSTRVAQVLSAAQIREQAVRDAQGAAVVMAQQEVETAQQTGLMAIAEALTRLSEQNVALHNQTQMLMSRMITSAAPTRAAATEERGQSESTDNEWQRLAADGMSQVNWASAGDSLTPFLDAQEHQSPSSPRRSQQGVSRQSPY